MSRNKAKGTRAESAVVDYLNTCGWRNAERRAPNGAKDRGDIAGIPDVVIEVKDHAALDLAGWITEAERERANAGAVIGVVWHKRRGKGRAEDWYVTMPGWAFTELLSRWDT